MKNAVQLVIHLNHCCRPKGQTWQAFVGWEKAFQCPGKPNNGGCDKKPILNISNGKIGVQLLHLLGIHFLKLNSSIIHLQTLSVTFTTLLCRDLKSIKQLKAKYCILTEKKIYTYKECTSVIFICTHIFCLQRYIVPLFKKFR